jgi:hypothetical protein
MARSMRPTASRLTQGEFQQFLGVNPSYTNAPSANRAIATDIYAAKVLQDAKTSFTDAWEQTHGTQAGMAAAWNKWRNDHFSDDLRTYYHGGQADKLKDAQQRAKGLPSVGQGPGAFWYNHDLQQKKGGGGRGGMATGEYDFDQTTGRMVPR